MAASGYKNLKKQRETQAIQEDLCVDLSSIPAIIAGLCSTKQPHEP